MAFLMFLTSSGFAMDMHYCQGRLIAVGFFGRAKTCHGPAQATTIKNDPLTILVDRSQSKVENTAPCHGPGSQLRADAQKWSKKVENCRHHPQTKARSTACSEDGNCCSNRNLYFQSDLDQQVQNADIMIGKQSRQFIVAFFTVFLRDDICPKQAAIAFAHYKPPPIARDIPVLSHSLLL